MAVTAALFMEMETVRDGYVELVERVLKEGRDVKPRGLPCREVSAFLVVRNAADYAMPVGCGRSLNQAIGAAEALQLIGGVSTPVLLNEITANFSQFMDGQEFYGAYGPRVRAQLPEVQRKLEADPDTRQAIVTIWRVDDLWVQTKDLPCTLTLHFFVRDDQLELHTHMRSQDAWWGWSYDAFQFTRLQVTMADALGLGLGAYYHRADSFHLYDRDHEAAGRLALEDLSPHDWHRPQLALGPCPIEEHMAAARALLRGDAARGDVNGWYRDKIERYLV